MRDPDRIGSSDASQATRLARLLARWWWVFPLALFVRIFLLKLNAGYPLIGHDYAYFFERLIAGRAHFAEQGIAPMRWTPYFCGGMVGYGNPQDLFYSPLQLLALFLDPWLAIQLWILALLLAGYAGWFLFARDALSIPRAWSHVLSLIVLACGFHLLHAAAGHVGFLPFPLIGLLLWLLYKPGGDSLGALARDTAATSLLVVVLIHAGGYYVLLNAALSALVAAPFLLTRPDGQDYRRLVLLRAGLYGCASLILCASKIVAVLSFMRNVPRMLTPESNGDAAEMFAYALRALWAIPQYAGLFSELQWDIHEHSMLLSPIVAVGLLLSPRFVIGPALRGPGRPRAILLLAISAALFLGLLVVMGGRGGLVDALWELPVLRSLHVPTRFLYLLALALPAVAVTALAAALPKSGRSHAVAVGSCTAVTLLAFAGGYPATTIAEVDLSTSHTRYVAELAGSPLPLPVVRVREGAWMIGGDTSRDCYEPLFDTSGRSAINRLQLGPVALVKDDAFNMINPACWQYPEENGCSPGDRIGREEWTNFSRFTSSQETDWRISDRQRTADRLSLLGVVGSIGVLGASLWRSRRRSS